MAELAGMDLAGNALERQPGGSHKTSVHPIVVGWISGSETSTAAGSQTETSNCQTARPRRTADAARPRRRGDRIESRFAAIAHGRYWHKAAGGNVRFRAAVGAITDVTRRLFYQPCFAT